MSDDRHEDGAAPNLKEEPWTLAGGIRAALRSLARRAGAATAYWLPFAVALAYLMRLGSPGGNPGFPWMFAMVLFSLPAGVPVGGFLARGLFDEVDFSGWTPTCLAAAAAALVVVGGTFVASWITPFGSSHGHALVATMSGIGALAAVAWFTWRED